MPETATVIMLTAGSMTFLNEWYQTRIVDWKVPVATLVGAMLFDGLSHLDSTAATGLATMVLIAASVTQFNGKSVADTVSEWLTAVAPPKGSKKSGHN